MEAKQPAVGDWMLIHLVAKRTEAVGRLIIYPFVVWFVMLLSRYSYFDNWYTPYGLAMFITLGAVFAWCCALFLRRAAEDLRKETLHNLDTKKAMLLSLEKTDEPSIKHIEEVMQYIKTNQEGAFAPFMQHPLVKALVAPISGG